MLLAFFVLALGTNNWLLGLFTCGFVGFVVVMIFGIVQLAGFNLGFFESLHFTAVIAIAMAYFVPLTCAYATATAVDKLERARKALQVAGPAITIGMEASTHISFGMFIETRD
jgi:predicted RND superfamily exporter protein